MIIVGLSGGVDSAVAALQLLRAGEAVQGLFMYNWDDADAHCTAAEDFQDARAVASELGIVLHRVDFRAEYRERVFRDLLDAYAAGRTPNPDVLCNREIKFGICLEHARRLGADAFATGHYARLVTPPVGMPELHKARDEGKDQSYFLHAVRREELADVRFPLGELLKSQVRELARAAGLPVAEKPDSTGICFIGERPFRAFLAQHLPPAPGPIEDERGEALGTHQGLQFHTLGQRAGLGIGGRRGATEAAWYVAGKDPARNALVVVQGQHHPLLHVEALRARDVHWLDEPPATPFDAMVKLRYRQPDQPARIVPLAQGAIRIELTSPQRAVTPGQCAVLYRGTRCLGGGLVDVTL